MTITYPNLVVTSIQCEEFKDGKEVHFTEDTLTGSKARFLINVEQIEEDIRGRKKNGKRKFKASVVNTKEEIEAELAKFGKGCTPLFCVHGFNTEPGGHLDPIKEVLPKFKEYGKYYPVPVLWPSEGGYTKDRGNARDAGKLLKVFVDLVPNTLFPRKSIMMHSMGNHVVFNGACGEGTPDVQFENIFMVGADVPFDIIHNNPGNDSKYKKTKAERFVNMLKKNPDGSCVGKIYVLHNSSDLALAASNVRNWENRIGQRGIGAKKVRCWKWSIDASIIRGDIKSIYENKNCADEPTSNDFFNHNYQFDDWAIKFYSDKSIEKN